MSKEIAKKQSTDVAIPQHLDEWGTGPVLSKKDTIIPKVMLQQAMSKKVLAGTAAFGELRDSITNAKYGDFNTPMEFVPLHYQPLWIESEYEKSKNDFIYKRSIPITAENDDLPYEDGLVKRTRVLNFYVLLPEEVSKGVALPKVLSFKVTSLRAGRKLATQMHVSNRAAGLSPAGMVMKLSVKKESNDKGTFAVLDVEQVRASTEKEVASALSWFKTVKQSENIKVDDSDLQGGAEEADLGSTGNF